MFEVDKLFSFMHHLLGWAQVELRRQGVKDLLATMATAEGLVDYKVAKADIAYAAAERKFKGSKKRKKENGDGGKDKQP